MPLDGDPEATQLNVMKHITRDNERARDSDTEARRQKSVELALKAEIQPMNTEKM